MIGVRPCAGLGVELVCWVFELCGGSSWFGCGDDLERWVWVWWWCCDDAVGGGLGPVWVYGAEVMMIWKRAGCDGTQES